MAVPIQTPPPPSYAEQTMLRMEAERKLIQDEKFTSWGIIWTLFGFKMATIGVILYVARNSSQAQSPETMAYIAVTTWYWFFIPLVAISGFVAWRMRLRKVRKQAQTLKRSEFSAVSSSELAPLTTEEKERLSRIPHLAEQDR